MSRGEKNRLVRGWPDYELADCGEGERLERLGPRVVRRPAQQAVWRRFPDAAWQRADHVFERDSSGYGTWSGPGRLGPWEVAWEGLALEVKLTPFGHLGIFPEHEWTWRLAAERATARPGAFRLLHLFAYTGALTLAAARAGAEVTHVDAAKNTVEWARANARRSGLEDAPIRWIVEDARKYVAREARRGARYQAVVLDPPTFGRGAKKETWQIERDLADLVEPCAALLAQDASFLLLTCHTPGLVGPGLANLLAGLVERRAGRIEHGETLLAARSGATLPSGSYALWEGE